MKFSHLHSAGRGYREPLFPHGAANLSGYGSRLPILYDFGGRIGTFRCAAAMELGRHSPDKFGKGFETNHKQLSKISAKFTRLSSPSTFPEGDQEEEEYGLEMDPNLSYFKGLVLDLSYRPINVVCWRRAICMEFLEKADVLEYYDQTVSSPGGSFNIPAVLRVTYLVHFPKTRRIKVQLSRKNVFGRDRFTCQYCGSKNNLTIDHVFPASRGGKWIWENLVTACNECNSKKGRKTLEEAEMKLIRTPKAPKDHDAWGIPLTYATYKLLKYRERMPDEWNDYISKPLFGS